MSDPSNRLPALRKLIGREVPYLGQRCRVIELLEHGPELVLQCPNRPQVIQGDQFGGPRRRAPHLVTLALYPGEDGVLHPDLGELGDLS